MPEYKYKYKFKKKNKYKFRYLKAVEGLPTYKYKYKYKFRTDTENTDLVSSSGSSRVLLIKGGGWVGHQATGPNAAQTELDSL